jgi:hypothetical protein
MTAMEGVVGGPMCPSYNFIMAPEKGFKHFKFPTFKILAEMKHIIWEEEMSKEKQMEIDP